MLIKQRKFKGVNLKDTHKNSSKCLTDGRMVNKKTPKDANCSKNSRGCGSGVRVSLYFPLRAPCVSVWLPITENWVRNVESYGGLFYRIAGPLELILARAREKGQSWLKGQSGSRQLYHGSKQAASGGVAEREQPKRTKSVVIGTDWPLPS